MVAKRKPRCLCRLNGKWSRLEGEDDPSITWNKKVSSIKMVVKDVLDESRDAISPNKDISLWNEEVNFLLRLSEILIEIWWRIMMGEVWEV